MRLGVVVNDYSCCCCTSCMSFLFLLAHEPAALEEHIMELKHLTDCESYRGLKLLPCATSRCFPDTLVSHPDRDYFPVKYYPDRVYTYKCFLQFSICYPDRVLHTTRPGLPFITPNGFIALSESDCAGTELRVRHV